MQMTKAQAVAELERIQKLLPLIAEVVKEERKPVNRYAKTSYFKEAYGQSMGTVKNRKYGIMNQIKLSKGSIRARVYTQANGWLPYLTFGNSYDLNDKKNGILGDGSEILAVELYYITPEGYEYQMVHYRVSVQNNKNFYADQVDTLKASGMYGFAGDKYRFIDKFQAWIE